MMTLRPPLLRDERGTSIIEMGLAAPILAVLLAGMVDLSRAYSAKLQVEQAAQRTIEKIQRDGFSSGEESAVQTEAADAAGVATANVTVTSWLQCGTSTTKKAITGSCSGNEAYARYVNVAITKSYTPLMKLRWGTGASGTYTLHGEAGVRIQ